MQYVSKIVHRDRGELKAASYELYYYILYIEITDSDGASYLVGNTQYRGDKRLSECSKYVDMSYRGALYQALQGVVGVFKENEHIRIITPQYMRLQKCIRFHSRYLQIEQTKYESHIFYQADDCYYCNTVFDCDFWLLEEIIGGYNCIVEGDFLVVYGINFVVKYVILDKKLLSKCVALRRRY